jgi:hypothetical protein
MEMEKDMENNTDKTTKWAAHFKAHKELWHNPKISPYVKCFIRLLQLHRADSKGWSLSIRLVSKYLGVAPNTSRKIINQAIEAGLVESNTVSPRKRRKLRLTASLREPIERDSNSKHTFYHQVIQPVLRDDTKSESTVEPVNNKERYINANTEKSQVKPNEKIEESNPYKENVDQSFSNKNVPQETEAYRKFREKAKELGWKKKF